MKSISVQYQDLREGKIDRHQFLRNARMMFPNFVTNQNSFEDSVKILKQKGLLNEGDAVQGTPDKAPTYKYPNEVTKYKKVEQSPEVDEQDGVYPATTLTDIPKEKTDKKVKDKSDGLEPIKPKDTKNEMKKVKIVKESKKKLTEEVDFDEIETKTPESTLTLPVIIKKYYELYRKNPRTTFKDIARELNAPTEEIERIIIGAKRPVTSDIDENLEVTPSGVLRQAVEKLSKEELDALWKEWEKRGEKTFGGMASFPSAIDLKKQKLRETIKNLVRKSLSEYEEGDESDDAPSIQGVIDILVNNMINRIDSNDLNLEFTIKDIQDLLNDFQSKIGHRYSSDQADDIIEGAAIELKKQGYNIK